jgi:hypothetical protein
MPPARGLERPQPQLAEKGSSAHMDVRAFVAVEAIEVQPERTCGPSRLLFVIAITILLLFG